jgi:hypothetical protein
VAETAYLNFDLAIMRRAEHRYHLQVNSPGGNPVHDFDMPISPEEVAKLREVVQGPARDVVKGGHERRPADPDLLGYVRRLGERLFDSIFANGVHESFSASRQAAIQEQAAGVRVRLWLDDAPELAALPWEYLYNRRTQTYLGLSVQTPVVRFLSLPIPQARLQAPPPLRILVMISDPEGYPRLAVDQEWKTIDRTFKELEEAKLVSIDRVPSGTVDDLQECLGKDKQYHVFHFIGHGAVDPATGEALLLMEQRPRGRGKLIGREALKVALDHFPLRLVILNSCEGARLDGVDPFGGLAQSLVKQGIPAAVAMQFKVTDKAAITFARKFYGTMAYNHPVDAALAEARKAIYLDQNPTEWGTPVLYMNASDGQIFQFDRPTEEQLRQRQIEALASDARTALDNRNYSLALQKLQAIQKLQPETT